MICNAINAILDANIAQIALCKVVVTAMSLILLSKIHQDSANVHLATLQMKLLSNAPNVMRVVLYVIIQPINAQFAQKDHLRYTIINASKLAQKDILEMRNLEYVFMKQKFKKALILHKVANQMSILINYLDFVNHVIHLAKHAQIFIVQVA